MVQTLLPAGAAFLSCSPAPGGNGAPTARFVQAAGERIWIAPLVNKSNVERIPTWPRDSNEQGVLLKEFSAIADKFAAELRRCEKYGLYTVIDDSSRATVFINLTFGHARQVMDSLSMTVFMHVAAPAAGKEYDFEFQNRAVVASGSAPQDPFRYTALLLAEYRSLFPAREMAYIFYMKPK